MYEYFNYITKKHISFLYAIKKAAEAAFLSGLYVLLFPGFTLSFYKLLLQSDD